LRWCHRGVGM